jgi:hypothetical protein
MAHIIHQSRSLDSANRRAAFKAGKQVVIDGFRRQIKDGVSVPRYALLLLTGIFQLVLLYLLSKGHKNLY